ncbi:membrane protein [Flavobacterium rivuli WB 3.3-2 = DSM 21788]|uniref:Membrane protein n=1 Tax=Flavobacterium rivuli WB 3.3-2 = DSM 21788 TaxID=1121895 RepID=A0A0A2M726_9FLAO|nr:hypothetical protein [Flavobacterium rivuli]KGO87441.1 membrane protein [Flavobacterium rivuli WB 3.3-2 = DSM 21788]
MANSSKIKLIKDIALIKKAIWAYFLLLIFEGALRKWILPGLSGPLLIVRDPVALFIIVKAFQTALWKPNFYTMVIWSITLLGFTTALMFGHGSIYVALYGMRITLLHFPLIFIIGKFFSRDDVVNVGNALLKINIFMTVLVAVQFYSPQSAWVNRGIGGDEAGSGFSGALDFYRVPGVFSFTNGLSLFYGIAAAYICYFWVEENSKVSKKLLIASTIALLAAIPLSISRSVLFGVVLSLIFMLIVSGKNTKLIKNLITGVIGAVVFFFVLSMFSFFQTATAAFENRFTVANDAEGGLEGVLIDRFLGGLYGAVMDENSSFIGMGIGLGTNAGAKILGRTGFLISEGEWGRLIGEMGFFMGMIIILIRISITANLVIKGWKSINHKNILPWMLLSNGILLIVQGQWAQPTALGFSILIAGLITASLTKK